MRKLYLAGILVSLLYSPNLFSQSMNVPVKIIDVSPDAFYQDSLHSSQSKSRRVSIMGLKNAQANDVPGTIYIIDHQEIQLSGARDIYELLQQVPGISFGADVDGVIGIAMHGIWAHEGKYVIQINGLTLNETDFGTYAFAQRLMLSNISRVEIMFGPGTIIFGGSAALGVINVVTYAAGENDGTTFGVQSNASPDGLDRLGAIICGNHYLGNQTSISYSTNYNEGSKSSAFITFPDSTQINYRDSTKIRNSEVFIKLQRKNFSLQYYRNDYTFDYINQEYQVFMSQNQIELLTEKQLGSKHELNFRASAARFTPWFDQNVSDTRRLEANTHGSRVLGSVTLNSQFTQKFSFYGGLSAHRCTTTHEWAELLPDSVKPNYLTHLNGYAAFGEFNYKSKIGTFGASARGELNSYVNAEFAPRFFYIFKKNASYFKAVYSQGYKIPTIENINLGPADSQLITEHVQNIDLSFGVQSNQGDMIQASVFRSNLRDPILYLFDDVSLDNYANKGNIGAQGFELMAMLKRKDEFIRLGYSYNENSNKTASLPEMELPSTKSFQAIPRHKATALVGLRLLPWMNWSANVVYQSAISAYEQDENSKTGLSLTTYDASLLVNTFLHFEPVKYPWTIRAGVTNLLNSKYVIASPYNNGVAAIPMNTLQFQFDLQYRLTR
jgi:outer membrane cobalamin receptor